MSAHFRFDLQGETGTGATGPAGPPGPRGPTGPSGEILDPSGNLDLSCNNLLDVSGIYFCNGTSITTFSGECITISGCLDMSCNNIIDVSTVWFCDDIVLGTIGSNPGIAIGSNAGGMGTTPGGGSSLDAGSIAIGTLAGSNYASRGDAVAIGHNTGTDFQEDGAVAVGSLAASTSQGTGAVAVGYNAASSAQGPKSVAIGYEAGKTSQGANSIAIGNLAGEIDQSDNSIVLNATGVSFSVTGENTFYVKPIRQEVSNNVLYYDEGTGEITYGVGGGGGIDLSCSDIIDVSGIYFCNGTSITTFSAECLTISGCLDMSCNSIVDVSQIDFCNDIVLTKPAVAGGIAIGHLAGYGTDTIAIGDLAGQTTQDASTIILNATGSALNSTSASSFYVKPIRQEVSNNVLYYDEGTGEITYGVGGGGGIDLSCSDIIDVSNIFFCNSDAILGKYRDFTALGYPGLGPQTDYPVLDISGVIDMSCNPIVDVSRIYFCGGPITTGRNWIGTGTSFDISCIESLKMTVPADSSASIMIGSTAEFQVDASHVSIQAGSLDTPALNFGLIGTDTDTGFYRIGSNAVGVAGEGKLVSSFWGGITSVGYSPGLNVGAHGTSGAPQNIVGIKRHSAVHGNSWEDGNCGNSAFIFFTATDFVPNGATSRNWQYTSNAATGPVSGVSTSGLVDAPEIAATKLIPKGFRISRDTLFPSLWKIYCAGANPGVGSSIRWALAEQQIAGTALNPFTNLQAGVTVVAVDWTLGVVNDNLLSIGGTPVVSDGTLSCVVYTHHASGAPWQGTNGIVGARVPIERA